MSQYWMLIAILLPIVGGILVKLIPFSNQRIMRIYLECIMMATSLIVFLLAGMNTGSGTFHAGSFYFFSNRWHVHGIFRTGGIPLASCHAVFF